MNRKLKTAGILDIVLASCTILLVAAAIAFFYAGGLGKDTAEDWQSALGYVFYVIVILPLIFISFAGMVVFSVFWLVSGIKLLKAAKSEVVPAKLVVADMVIKLVAIALYVFGTIFLFGLSLPFGVLLACVFAYLIVAIVFNGIVLGSIKRREKIEE